MIEAIEYVCVCVCALGKWAESLCTEYLKVDFLVLFLFWNILSLIAKSLLHLLKSICTWIIYLKINFGRSLCTNASRSNEFAMMLMTLVLLFLFIFFLFFSSIFTKRTTTISWLHGTIHFWPLCNVFMWIILIGKISKPGCCFNIFWHLFAVLFRACNVMLCLLTSCSKSHISMFKLAKMVHSFDGMGWDGWTNGRSYIVVCRTFHVYQQRFGNKGHTLLVASTSIDAIID